MILRIVLVEPEGRMNFGQVLRLSKNFGVDDICVVKPRFDIQDREVIEFAAGGADLLEKVRVVSELRSCLEGVDFSVCTTSIAGASEDPLRQAITPRAIAMMLPRDSKIALVFGRESVGLTRSELAMCSLISTLITPSDYNVLNISHAVAIYLYELTRATGDDLIIGERCGKDYLGVLIKYVERLGSAYELNQDEVVALKHVVYKALLTKAECRALYKLLKSSLAYYTKSSSRGMPPPVPGNCTSC